MRRNNTYHFALLWCLLFKHLSKHTHTKMDRYKGMRVLIDSPLLSHTCLCACHAWLQKKKKASIAQRHPILALAPWQKLNMVQKREKVPSLYWMKEPQVAKDLWINSQMWTDILQTHTQTHLTTNTKVSIILDVGDLSLAFSVSGNLISTLAMTILRPRSVSEEVSQFVSFCDTCFSSFVSSMLKLLAGGFLLSFHDYSPHFTLLCIPLCGKPNLYALTLFSLWWVRYSVWSKSFLLIVVEENRMKLQDMAQISLRDIRCGLPEQLFILFLLFFLLVISFTVNTLKLVWA